jgi:site-specific DNA recombinase
LERAELKSNTPEVVVATWRAGRKDMEDLSEAKVRLALEKLDPVWNDLFPAEQARIVHLLVERVDVAVDGIDIRVRTRGIATLARELSGSEAA